MNAGQQLHAVLTADAGVSAITTTVRPMWLYDADVLPAIVYQVVSTDPGGSLGGDTTGLDRVRVQIDCWADGYSHAVDLADAVRDALRYTKGGPIKTQFIDTNPVYNTETRRYRVSADYYVWQQTT